MANKSVNDFVKDLVESPQELPIFPTTWDKKLENYVAEDQEQAQDQGKSEEE